MYRTAALELNTHTHIYKYIYIYIYVFICSVASVTSLCDSMDRGLLGFSVHGIFLARILEWVAMPFSRGSIWSKDRTHISYISHIAYGFFTSEPPGKQIHINNTHTHTHTYISLSHRRHFLMEEKPFKLRFLLSEPLWNNNNIMHVESSGIKLPLYIWLILISKM